MKDNYHTGNYVPYSSKSACVGSCTSHRSMKYEEYETRWAYGLSFSSEKTRSAYHLNGIFGNSRKNSTGLVHPGGLFSFSCYFTRIPGNYAVPFVYIYQCQALYRNTSARKNPKKSEKWREISKSFNDTMCLFSSVVLGDVFDTTTTLRVRKNWVFVVGTFTRLSSTYEN